MLSVLFRMASLLLAAIAVPLSVLLLQAGVSWESKVFGMAGLLIGLGPLLICIGKERESKRLEMTGFGACLGWVILTGLLAIVAPAGTAGEGARIQHRYVKESSRFRPHALGNLLPELDQFLLGFKLVPLMDRLFTSGQAHRLSQLTMEIYQELESDPDFHALGSVMPQAYDDLWFQRADHGHYFLYVPTNLRRDRPAPAMVFLHGSGGNFKVYPWLLAEVADELGMVLICPSYGMGNWTSKDSAKLIQQTLSDAKRAVSIDSKQIHLMGLSNGGLGVGHVARDLGDQFKSITLISPVVDREVIQTPKFFVKWKGKSVCIISGAEDDRVPLPSVEAAASAMTKKGIQVTLKAIPSADHFLLFSHRQEVIAQLKAWLKEPVVLTPAAAEGSP